MSWLTAILFALFVMMTTAVPIRAEATPSPAPAGCTVEHRSAAAIVEAAGSGGQSVEIPDAIPYRAPDGTPADAETNRRVGALVQDVIDCVNSGDIVGFMSLLSDDFLRRHFASFDLSAEELAELERAPTPMNVQVSLIDLRDITVLPGGRIFVLVLLDQGEQMSPELTSGLTLIEVDGKLRIDEWQPVTLAGSSSAWDVIRGDGYEGWIVPLEQVENYVYSLTGETVQGVWTPTPDQIATLEAKLPGFLAASPNAAPDLADRIGGYRRHYAGFVADGRALILVNAFCSIPAGGSDSKPVIVMDGGDCFLHVSYDPNSAAFEDLSINGEA